MPPSPGLSPRIPQVLEIRGERRENLLKPSPRAALGDGGPELLPLARPWATLLRPYRALRGGSGILPLHLSRNFQSPYY